MRVHDHNNKILATLVYMHAQSRNRKDSKQYIKGRSKQHLSDKYEFRCFHNRRVFLDPIAEQNTVAMSDSGMIRSFESNLLNESVAQTRS